MKRHIKVRENIKKPVIIEAYKTDKEFVIPTLEGDMKASVGDYIITGVDGEQYPCKPDIFDKTYEAVTNTNYDRIKAMNIDEMASFFDNIQTYDLRYPNDFDDWKKYLESEVSGMTNEEAIKTIKHGCIYRDARGGAALEIAVDALEKQIPKKPLHESLADRLCPICQSYIPFDTLNDNVEEAPKFCPHCGQKLDWSDTR